MKHTSSTSHCIPATAFIALFLTACAPESPADLRDRQIAIVFATAGDAQTEVSLDDVVSTGAVIRIANEPVAAMLSGTVVILDHASPVHEAVRLQVEHADKIESLVIWHAVQPATAPAWPLTASDDRRYLVDDTGSPVFWTGGSPWGLTVVPDRDEAARYLADRAGKKVNAVLVRLIDHLFSDHTPAWLNHYHHPPFIKKLDDRSLDFTAPGENYWRQVDWVIREAYQRGITVLGAPSYVGYRLGEQGWAAHMKQNGPDRLYQYGQWLARRYADYPNIVWVMGGDWSTAVDDLQVTEEVDALATGIKSVHTAHLMTAHSHRNRSAVDDYNRPWLDINSSYGGYSTIHQRVRTDYQRSPRMPTFLIEGHYGNEHGMNDRKLRTQMYHALLGGAFGQLYGNAPQWYFSADAADHFADQRGRDWREHLDAFGAQFLPVAARLIHEYPLANLEPDFDHLVMTAGNGADDDSYAPLLYSPRLAIAYLPEQRQITIDLSRFENTVQARWRSPQDGAETDGDSYSNDGLQTLAPPDAGDWILILDAGGSGN